MYGLRRVLLQFQFTKKKGSKFESVIHLHNMAKRMAQNETHLDLLGYASIGEDIHKYTERIEVTKGQTIWRSGDINSELYLIQHGRISCYVGKGGPRLERQMSLRSGAFLNEDSLYVDAPQLFTVTADQDSSILGLSRTGMKQLITVPTGTPLG